MSSDLLSTAVTGLRVAQSSLSTSGHNIANANVEGYSRQVVRAETNPATPQGGIFIGNGANVASVDRQVNDFLTEQLRRDTTLFHDLETFQGNIAQLDTLLSDGATGLSGAFESFFASMQNGADDPTSIPSRQLIVSESENLSDRFNTVYGRLISIGNSINTGIETAVSEINSLVTNVADLNLKIADALGSGNGQPNDLLDQRDQTLRELSKYISFQTYEQGFGEVNILIASGQNLVVGSESRELAVIDDPADPERKQVVFVSDVAQRQIPSDALGGELGGLFRFRDESLTDTYNNIGRIAVVMADTFNDIHGQGLDLQNNFGGNFFYDVNDDDIALDRVIGSSENPPPNDRILRAYIQDASQLQLSDYEVSMVNDGMYSITRLSDDTEIARNTLSGSYPFSAEFEGIELVFERGSFQAGDSFVVQAVRSGARDFSSSLVNPEELAFASPLLTDTSLSNIGSAEISAGQLISLTDNDGDGLPLFATPGQMSPPLVVRFVSEDTYEILDNSDPGNPVSLSPPITNQRYIRGVDNVLFSSDPGETQVLMNGADTGLPAGSTPAVGGGALLNGYASETITILKPSPVAGAAPISHTILTAADASARTTASLLSNVEGVSANASTYAELSGTSNLTRTSPLQININGEDLIEYEFDSGTGTFVVATQVPDPATEEADFNDYIASRINENENLQALGVSAFAAYDSVSGVEEIQIRSSQGDDIQISLEADAGGPDAVNVSDGVNPAVALNGNGAGVSSAIAVGGTIDVRLADMLTLETAPSPSGLFGDSTAADFAQSTYLGIQASIRGNPQQGDTFTLNFNFDAASDNRNALAMVQLESEKTVGGGVTSYSGSYASLVETVGIDTSSSRINRDASEQVLEQSEDLRNSISAVNLDEEASDLIRFEQLYSANAQVISVARDLFDRLINSL